MCAVNCLLYQTASQAFSNFRNPKYAPKSFSVRSALISSQCSLHPQSVLQVNTSSPLLIRTSSTTPFYTPLVHLTTDNLGGPGGSRILKWGGGTLLCRHCIGIISDGVTYLWHILLITVDPDIGITSDMC